MRESVVYVTRKGDKYKLGFSRSLQRRLVRLNHDELIVVIPVPSNRRPAQLEYLLNNRFASKRLPPQGNKPGDKREWFKFSESDLNWLRGFASFIRDYDLLP